MAVDVHEGQKLGQPGGENKGSPCSALPTNQFIPTQLGVGRAIKRTVMTVIKSHLGYEQVPPPGPPRQSIRKKEKHFINITSLMFLEHQNNGKRSFVKEAFCIKSLALLNIPS